MSKRLIASLVIFTLGFSAIAEAQESKPRVRKVPTSGTRAMPATPSELEKNISITVDGALNSGTPINLTLTGCGRMFQSEAVVGTMEVAGQNIPVIASIRFVVRPLGVGYMINYSVGSRLPIATSVAAPAGKAQTVNVSFQDVLITGDVRIKSGETIEVFKAGDQSIKLGVAEKD